MTAEKRSPWLPETATIERQLLTLKDIGASARVVRIAEAVLAACRKRDAEEAGKLDGAAK